MLEIYETGVEVIIKTSKITGVINRIIISKHSVFYIIMFYQDNAHNTIELDESEFEVVKDKKTKEIGFKTKK